MGEGDRLQAGERARCRSGRVCSHRRAFITRATHRLSELRALTILEGLRGGLKYYRLVDGGSRNPAGLHIWQKQQQKADSGLEGRALKAHEQAQIELKHFCDKLLEEHEDEITAKLQEQGSPLLSGEHNGRACRPWPCLSGGPSGVPNGLHDLEMLWIGMLIPLVWDCRRRGSAVPSADKRMQASGANGSHA